MLIANEGKKTNPVPPRWIQFMTKVNPLWGVSWPFNVTKNWQKKIGILLTLRVGWHTCKRNPCSMLVVARRKYFPLERWELLVGIKKAPWTPSSTKTLIRTSSFRLQKRVFTPWALKWSMRCRYSQACPWISNFSPPSNLPRHAERMAPRPLQAQPNSAEVCWEDKVLCAIFLV